MTAVGLATVMLLASACTSPTQWRRARQAAFERQVSEPRDPEIVRRRPRRRRRPRPRRDPQSKALDSLAAELGAAPAPIDNPCRDVGCTERVLDSVFRRLDLVDRDDKGSVRILHLGDSHIAADYITRVVRARLQSRFGNAGRGFVAVDQRARYGGRRLRRSGWRRTRIVDEDGPGRPFGFAGMAIHSKETGAQVTFGLRPEDDNIALYYQGHPRGPRLSVYAEEELIGEVSTRASAPASWVMGFPIPEHRLGGAVPPEWLRIEAQGPDATVFGLSFESVDAGVLYDAIGPVGADARVYLELEPNSVKAHLGVLAPDLIVLMVGGNDALMVRKGERTLAEVRDDHVRLVRRLQSFVPTAACLLFGPMDAAERLSDGTLVTKRYIPEVRDIQREVAAELGCAFWDAFDSMGGHGSFAVWLDAGIMNEDLVHPRSVGGDLLGHLFARALMNAYLAG